MRELVGQGKPFYSALDKAAGLLRRKVGTGSEFLKELMSIPGVKQAEIAERGLGELLNAPKMTHEQFMAALSAKPAPAIHEKIFNVGNTDDPRLLTPEERNYPPEGLTYHENWTLPGGENYREMLIKAPKGVNNQEKIMELEAKLRRIPMFNSTPEQQAQIATYYNQVRDLKAQEAASPKPFQGVSAHFGGEPGILASMRLKDRMVPDLDGPHSVKVIGGGGTTTVKHPTREAAEQFAEVKHQGGYRTEITPLNQKKLLHLEELQSDWHQQGREKGYNQKIDSLPEGYTVKKSEKHNSYNVWKPDGELFASGMSPETATANAIDNLRRSGVPDAPFKKNWEEMALKRLIHHAAENGYHGVVVTPGAEQAKRYDLSKQISRVVYSPETEMLNAFDLDNKSVIQRSGVKPDQIADYIGKDPAQRLLDEQNTKLDRRGGKDVPYQEISGLDLKVGGEGMKAFYDKKVPNILNGIGKKYGVKTELGGHKLPGDPSQRGDASERLGLAGERLADMSPEQVQAFNQKLDDANAKQLHYFPITEEMRQDVKKNGIPLYKSGGIVSTH